MDEYFAVTSYHTGDEAVTTELPFYANTDEEALDKAIDICVRMDWAIYETEVYRMVTYDKYGRVHGHCLIKESDDE